MERRSFIKLSGLTTGFLLVGGNLFASFFAKENSQLIDIDVPNIHVRHGFFNLQGTKQNGLHIQRDIFNQNGLETISKNRITAIKVSKSNGSVFGIQDKAGFRSKSGNLLAFSLKANQKKSIQLDFPCIVFSEINDFTINGRLVKSDQALVQREKGSLEISSKLDQSVYLYLSEK